MLCGEKTTQPRGAAADIGIMIDPRAPDPFALVSWRTNLLPLHEPAKLVWLMCSVLHLAYGWTFLEVLEDYSDAYSARGVMPKA